MIAISHVTRKGSTQLMHGVIADDTVATAAAKLEAQLGGPVYMWCNRPVDAHEALAISVAGGYHQTGRAFVPAVAVRELKGRLGVALTEAKAASPLKMLAALQKHGEQIYEPVPMRNRYVVPGGYFANDDADPFDVVAPDSVFAAAHSRPFNTGDVLMESFYADTAMVTTRADLEYARPKGVSAAQWSAGVVDKYFPEVQDRDLFKFTTQADKQLREQRRIEYVSEPVITYIPITGGLPVGAHPGADRLIAAFAALEASESRPAVRIQGGGIDRPVSRIHDSFAEEDLRRVQPPAKKEWLQVVLKHAKGIANLTVLPSGTYKLQIRFGYLERARLSDAVPYIDLANAVLERVSPLIRPIHERYLRPSYSLYIQKPQLLDTPSVLGGPNNGVYQTVGVDLPARCSIEDVERIVGARGYPSLKGVNHHAGNYFLQWTRSNVIRKSSVVKNLVYHAAAHGGLTSARMTELTSELGLTKKEIAEISESGFDRHSVMTTVRAHLSSDTKLTVTVNGNDPEYGRRVGQAMSNILRECGKGRSKGVTDWSSAVSDSPDEAGALVVSGGDLDEFYEFFYEDEGAGAGAGAGAENDVTADPGIGLVPLKQKGDILERLKNADPSVFAFPGQPGYAPYSMKCQKNNKSTRQPLVLTKAELKKAESGSSAAALDNKLEYRGHAYVCPEKWCPVSGVARRLSEPCPDPDEPQWTLWNNNFPAFQPGVAHPDGLCMPCCFGTKVKPGGKKWEDMQKCLRSERDKDAEAGNEGDDPGDVKRAKTGHVNKADKLLDEGCYGKVPDDLYQKSTPGDAPVRRGMGNKAQATFANTLAFVSGHRTAALLMRQIAKNLKPEHFIQSDVREFMTSDDARAALSVSEAAIKKWMTPAYASLVGIKTSAKLKTHQIRREARIMLAQTKCTETLELGAAPSNASLFRLYNSGAIDAPSVMLVELDEAGNAHAEHACEHSMPASGQIAVIFKRRSSYEPIGFKTKNAFRSAWDADHPWLRHIFDSIRAQTPKCSKRVTSYSMMAVGCTTASGYLPFARPVFVDPAFAHTHVADFALAGPASDAEARRALELTGNRFYISTWKQVASATRTDSQKDEALFSAGEDDARSRTMRDLAKHLDASRQLTQSIRDDLIDTQRRPNETARNHIKRLSLAAKGIVPEDVDPTDLDYAVERIVHPIPAGVVPSVKTQPREKIVYF